jgi:hypothetical protein
MLLRAVQFIAPRRSAFGTKRTCQSCRSMSAFGGKADLSRDRQTIAILCVHALVRRATPSLKTLGHPSRCAAGSPGILLSIAAKVACSVATTCAPSPTAAATRLIEPERTSPIAKIPRRLVSSGFRVSLQSPPASTKPFASNATPDPDNQSVFGSAPMNKQRC